MDSLQAYKELLEEAQEAAIAKELQAKEKLDEALAEKRDLRADNCRFRELTPTPTPTPKIDWSEGADKRVREQPAYLGGKQFQPE